MKEQNEKQKKQMKQNGKVQQKDVLKRKDKVQQKEVQQKEKVQEKSLAQQRIELQQEKEARKKLEEQLGKETQQANGAQQEKRSRSGRYRMNPRTPKEKLQYFIDYYLLYTVIGLIIVVVSVSLLKTMIFDRTEKALSVVVMSYLQPDTEVMTNELREYLRIEDEDQIINISCLTPGDYQTEMAMTTWIAAQDVDLIITEPETFESYAAKGYFMDLSEALEESLLARVENDLKEGQTVEYDETGEIISYGEACNYGIGISLNETGTDFTQGGDYWILSVCVNAKNLENVRESIPYFLD